MFFMPLLSLKNSLTLALSLLECEGISGFENAIRISTMVNSVAPIKAA
jgi:hypothetical protein